MKTGTPLQALKFSLKLNNAMGELFLKDWLAGKDMSRWSWLSNPPRADTGSDAAKVVLFADFCEANPDEPERADGRKAHYGAGRQPLDDIIDAGWGESFCAGNVLKYLRRDKQVEDSRKKAKWYWDKLRDIARASSPGSVTYALVQKLTDDELRLLGAAE